MKTKQQVHTIAAKHNKKVILIAPILLLIFVLIMQGTKRPERSAESFCRVLSEEKSRLATFPGDTYPSGVFNEELSNAQEFADSFAKLEKVAPEEIRTDVSTIKSLYAKIHADPSQAIAVGLSGIDPEDNVEDWIENNCEIDI